MENIKKGKFQFKQNSWKGVTKEAKDFISKLLVKDPIDRLNAEQALQHPWFSMKDNQQKIGIDQPLHQKALKNLRTFRAD